MPGIFMTSADAHAGPFIAVSCAAFTESLAKSELFGHERGIFTGALTRRGGLRRRTEGTLLLDEIGDLPAAVQVKLLARDSRA